MTGYQVEFVDDAVPTAVTTAQPPSRPRIGPISLIAPALWFSAAALCVLAGTRVVWTYSFGGTIRSRGGYDAWGRALDHNLAGDRGPCYAVVLWLCAALFTVLTVVALRGDATLGDRWLRKHTTAIGIGVTALLAGVLASIGLSVQSTFETYTALGRSLDAAHGVELHIGGCVWCGLAALVSAIAAGVGHARVSYSDHLASASVRRFDALTLRLQRLAAP